MRMTPWRAPVAMPDDGSESSGGEAGLRGAPIDKLPLERRLLFCEEASSISVELARVGDTSRPSERESVFLMGSRWWEWAWALAHYCVKA